MLTNEHALLALQQAAQQPQELTPAGWLFMAVAWAAILLATLWSFGKILRGKK